MENRIELSRPLVARFEIAGPGTRHVIANRIIAKLVAREVAELRPQKLECQTGRPARTSG